MENEANDGTIAWTVNELFGENDKMISHAEQIYKQLLPGHPWLILGPQGIDVDSSNIDEFYQAIGNYARRRERNFKGLELVLLVLWQPRHDTEGLASLFG